MAHRPAQHGLGLCLDRVVDRQRDVLALPHRRRRDDVDRPAEGVLDDRLRAGLAGQPLVQLQLQAREPVVVDARVAEHLRRDGVLRVGAALLAVGVEARDVLAGERRRLGGVALPAHVDERLRPVGEQLVQAVRLHEPPPERLLRCQRGRARIDDLTRVGVDGRRLLAERELEAGAVEERPAARRQDLRVAVLGERELRQRRGADALQPEGADEDRAEGDEKGQEQEADPAVDDLGRQGAIST